ncbi:MAG TPA: hypothetical protein VJU61_17170 [Polyangiaceae bacterium]|nr:hypothetical protein [Polyangiaceae bacterium]
MSGRSSVSFACHSAAAQFSLGLETRQLNIDGFYPSTARTVNQRYTLDYIGMLNGNTALPPFPAIDDDTVCSWTRRGGAALGVDRLAHESSGAVTSAAPTAVSSAPARGRVISV